MKARMPQMRMPFFFCFLCAVLILFFAESGYPQAPYPDRPINFIQPSPAGSGADLACRAISKEAEQFLGQPIITVNKTGASLTIGIAAIAASKPDGYTIGYAGHPGMFTAPHLQKVPYHPVKDLTEVMQFGFMDIAIIVKGDSPFKNAKDLVAYARQNPGKLTYGSAGVGALGSIAMQLIAKKEGVQFTSIPFKGAPETEAAVLGGHVLVGVTGSINQSLLEAGQTKLLFLVADSRSAEYPNIPILKDLGYDIPAPTPVNIAGPKGMPEDIVKKLEEAFTKAMKGEVFLRAMKDLRMTVFHRNSKELTDYVAYNYELYGKLLKEVQLTK
ncbi:MAG: tripartite tricarboxylate transporter substrate binding protein [Syntrophales bacterium LBB04]|nr:tripartite tricarboxylate transporter substrate binding protein [Syntrophales bacterium LBB04]